MTISKFLIFRLAIFADLTVFSIIVLGLSSNFIVKYNSGVKPHFGNISQPAWAGLAIATTVLTLIPVALMLLADVISRGIPIFLEVATFGILSIFWLATAADTTANSLNKALGFHGGCGSIGQGVMILVVNNGIKLAQSLCHQQQVVAALSFVTWLLLFAYAFVLIYASISAKNRGNSEVWKTSACDANLFTKALPLGDGNADVTNAPLPSNPAANNIVQ